MVSICPRTVICAPRGSFFRLASTMRLMILRHGAQIAILDGAENID